MKRIMRKLLYSVIALAAIFTVSCNKEADMAVPSRLKRVVVDITNLPSHTETLTAEFGSGLTRTDYSGKTFTWLQNDSILVYVQSQPDENEMVNIGFAYFYAQSDGPSVTFVGNIPDGYDVMAPAFYLATNASLDLGEDEEGYWDGTYYVQMPSFTILDGDPEIYYTAESDKPLANMPLLGSVSEDGKLHFSSMTGAIKLTLTDLDAKASMVEISNAGSRLTGYFHMGEDGTLQMKDARVGTYETTSGTTMSYSYGYSVMEFTPNADHTAEIYMALPVGTLKAGTTITILDDDFNTLFERSFKKDVAIERNTVTEIASLKAAYSIQSLGTGKYYDDLIWYFLNGEEESSDYVDVEISYDAGSGKYFIANPYGAAATHFNYHPAGTVTGPDEMLILEVLDGGIVNYPTHKTGYFISSWNDGAGDEMCVTPPYYYSSNYPDYYAYFGRGNNFIAKYASDGKTPANVILSPVYDGVDSYNWTGENYIQANPIQILFPGADPIDINAKLSYNGMASNDPAQPTVNATITLGADLAGAKLVAATDKESAEAAIAANENVTTVSASGNAVVKLPANAVSGQYTLYAKLEVASGLNPTAGTIIASDPFNYENASDYESLGTGYFYDTYAFYLMNGSQMYQNYIEVEIRKHRTENKYIIVNPYGIAAEAIGYSPAGSVSGPDENLVITVDENDIVNWPDHFKTGVFMSSWNTSGDELCITPPAYYSENYPSYYAYFGTGYNFVAKYDENGVATNIFMSPVYDGAVGNNWTGDSYIESNFIEIIMPGGDQLDLSISGSYQGIYDENPAQAIADVNVKLGDNVQAAKVVIAQDKEAALAAFASGTNVAVATETSAIHVNFPANAPSGEYHLYVLGQAEEGCTEAANLLSESRWFDYFREDEDLGLVDDDFFGKFQVKNTTVYQSSRGNIKKTISMTVEEADDLSYPMMISSLFPELFTGSAGATPEPFYFNADPKTGLFQMDGSSVVMTTGSGIRKQQWIAFDIDDEDVPINFYLRPDGTVKIKQEVVLYNTTSRNYYILDSNLVLTKVSEGSAPAAAPATRSSVGVVNKKFDGPLPRFLERNKTCKVSRVKADGRRR